MSDVFDIPGARVVLEAVRMLDKAGIDWDERYISYREKEWSPKGPVPVEPHFEIALDCSDTFGWGVADAQEITGETLPILEATLKDWKYGLFPLGDLYAARVRKMRPQGACYKVRYDPSTWRMFDECGPERELGPGNPKRPG